MEELVTRTAIKMLVLKAEMLMLTVKMPRWRAAAVTTVTGCDVAPGRPATASWLNTDVLSPF